MTATDTNTATLCELPFTTADVSTECMLLSARRRYAYHCARRVYPLWERLRPAKTDGRVWRALRAIPKLIEEPSETKVSELSDGIGDSILWVARRRPLEEIGGAFLAAESIQWAVKATRIGPLSSNADQHSAASAANAIRILREADLTTERFNHRTLRVWIGTRFNPPKTSQAVAVAQCIRKQGYIDTLSAMGLCDALQDANVPGDHPIIEILSSPLAENLPVFGSAVIDRLTGN